ncbi:MAG TPA: glycosyltransferase [Saprospiraceae bacterium]|nr:glycosyltransferase [Saprospiraceae bacterium]
MKVTIITPTFNSAKTIGDTLESVASQDYPDIEHIIIDGKSTDETLDIVSRFPHVAKVISEKDAGIYDAMNKGLIAAKGDLVAVLNSDDLYVGDTVVSDVVSLMLLDNSNIVYADLDYVDRDDINKISRVWFSGPYRREQFKMGWAPPHPTFFAKKELYERFGGFNLAFKSSADYELMFRFLYVNKQPCAYLRKTIVKMRRGGYSNISIKNRINANIEDRRSWKVNKVKMPFWVPIFKPLRKVPQFFPSLVKS